MRSKTRLEAAARSRAVVIAGLGLVAVMTVGTLAHAQLAGRPLARCDVTENAFYLLRFSEGNPGTNALIKVGVSGSGSALANTQTQVWTGRSPGTVAAGMRPQDGYIYGIRAVSGDSSDAPSTWQQDFRAFQVIRYGTAGAENLGVIDATSFAMTGTPPHSIFDPSPNPNFNAADIDPKTGQLVVGMLRVGNYGRSGSAAVQQMKTLLHIDVTSSPPKLVKVTDLSVPVLLNSSGDFAIDATGTYAYGISYASPERSGFTLTKSATSYFWRADLASGAVTQTVVSLPVSSNLGGLLVSPMAGDQPYGGGALLPDGTYAFYANQTPAGVAGGTATDGRLLNIDASGAILGYASIIPGSASADAARCLPKLVAKLQCTPTSVVDSPTGNVSECTVTLDQPAPAGGLSVALVPPPGDPARYTTTCGSTLPVPAGETKASCNITAIPNDVPGDGFVDAHISLATPAADADYILGSPSEATVRINDDDIATPIPTLGTWALGLLSLGLGGLAWRRRTLRR